MLTRILRLPVCRAAAWYLSLTFAGLFLVPSIATAAFIAPAPGQEALSFDAAAVRVLEDGVLTERLSALGLSADEISARLAALSPDERQAVMADLERLQAGGDSAIGVAILIILIIVIIKLLNKDIVIK